MDLAAQERAARERVEFFTVKRPNAFLAAIADDTARVIAAKRAGERNVRMTPLRVIRERMSQVA